MTSLLRRVAAKLPEPVRLELRRHHHARMIRRGTFAAVDPEVARLPQWVREGNWVVDVGANVGTWAIVLSRAVGPSGRVFCFEPVLSTFALLAANVTRFPDRNVTLVNAAATDRSGPLGMRIPPEHGLEGPWLANVVEGTGDFTVVGVTLDAFLPTGRPISLVKIDAEGHDANVLRGMVERIERDRPRLIVEERSTEIDALLGSMGYRSERLTGSPNRVYHPS